MVKRFEMINWETDDGTAIDLALNDEFVRETWGKVVVAEHEENPEVKLREILKAREELKERFKISDRTILLMGDVATRLALRQNQS